MAVIILHYSPLAWHSKAEGAHKTVAEDTAANKAQRVERIEPALQSGDPDKVLEGKVAKAVEDDVIDFNRKVGPNGATGEVRESNAKAFCPHLQ